jgi:predicted O-methyltransferase YrrM
MFQEIPEAVRRRMSELEAIDAADRKDGTPRSARLRQVLPDTARFLSLMAASAPEGAFVEIGTSAGYSAMWIGLACRVRGRRLTTLEVDPMKVALARETLRVAGMADAVEVVEGDAREILRTMRDIAFCFLDAEKEIYSECYDLVVPRMTEGGVLLADNTIDSRDVVQPMMDRALSDPRVDAVNVPIGKGVLLCRKAGAKRGT